MAFEDYYNGMMGGGDGSSSNYDWMNQKPELTFSLPNSGSNTGNSSWDATVNNNYGSGAHSQPADLSNYSYAEGYTPNTLADSSWGGDALAGVFKGAKDYLQPKGDMWQWAGGKLADVGSKALLGYLSPKPDMSGQNAMMAQMLDMQRKMNGFQDMQAAQYNQNVRPLQNTATSMALTAANPTERANRASRDFQMFSDARRKQREQQLQAAGIAPGSAEWTSAMSELDQADAIGHADAYNKGLQTAYDTGSNQLSSAYAMHPAPNYMPGVQGGAVAINQAQQMEMWKAQMAEMERRKLATLLGGYDAGKQTGLEGPTGGR